MSKSDMQLKQDIEAELRWDPRVNAAQIGVTVNGGAVTLLGTVGTYAEKSAASDVTRRVSGVRTVAQELAVLVQDEHKHSDSEIATAIQIAYRWNVLVPVAVTARVENGTVTLEGKATWNYQRLAAEHAIQNLAGVIAVHNHITLAAKPMASEAQVKANIEAALMRQAGADAKSIRIETTGGKVTLMGHASSTQSIQDATTAAWAAPGVTEVVDQVKMSTTF